MRGERRRRNVPFFKTHQRCHEEILANEVWFGDGEPQIGKQFTAEKAKERKDEVVNLLLRAASRERRAGDPGVADRLEILADKIFYCRPGQRCGSLACTECCRAFQKAKVAAQKITIRQLTVTRDNKLLVMATVIPIQVIYRPDQLAEFNVEKFNRWLKDVLTRAGFRRVMLGSVDLSWEAERGVYQPHWHIAMFTSDAKELGSRLKVIFPGQQRGDRPVVISKTYSLRFLRYKNKAIKIAHLLRNNRRSLPYLMLALDRTEPLELMVLSRIRVSAQKGALQFTEIQRR